MRVFHLLLLVTSLAQPLIAAESNTPLSGVISRSENLDDALGDSNTGGESAKFVLETGTDKDVAHLRIAKFIDNQLKAEIKFTAPFDEDTSDQSEITAFDGLANANTVTLGLSYNSYEPFKNMLPSEASPLRRPLCEAYAERLGLDFQADFNGECDNGMFRDDEIGREYLDKFWEAVGGVASYWVGGVNVSIGGESFGFVEEGDLLTKKKSNKEQFAASVYYSYIKGNSLSSLSYRHEEAYSASTKHNVCLDFGLGVLECRELVIGAPKKASKEFVSFEHRRRFSNSAFAISPKVTYDLEESETEIQLPIYFLRSTVFNLTGGIKFEWNSKDTEVRSSIFVGKSFSFLD